MKIIYIMGKSATGKDTILKEIIKQTNMKRYIPYTTRPKRKKEVDNVDYFFIDDENISDFKKQGKIIESRTYNTVSEKPWTYLTILDDQLTSNENLITIGTLESLGTFSKYILENDLDIKIIPIYIKVYPLIRFIRIIKREAKGEKPNYKEAFRRFFSDNQDYKKRIINNYNIKKTFSNNFRLETVTDKIVSYINEIK